MLDALALFRTQLPCVFIYVCTYLDNYEEAYQALVEIVKDYMFVEELSEDEEEVKEEEEKTREEVEKEKSSGEFSSDSSLRGVSLFSFPVRQQI